jgi:hypothetical protein
MKRGILLFLFYSGLTFSQNVTQDLLISHAEMTPEGQAQFKQKICIYHFLNGTFTGRDEVISIEGKKNGRDNIRTDKGKNIIYKNRYLVTGIGNIIDLNSAKILFDGKANLVRITNDSAIYYTNDAFKGKFYSVFNFKTGQYAEVTNLLFKAKAGKDIEFDKSARPFKINYYPQGKPKVELSQDAGYGQQHLKDNKYVPDPPVYWLSDSTFIYSHFNKEGTEIAVRKVNIETSGNWTLGSVPVAAGTTEAYFRKETGQAVVLYCNGSQVNIDLQKNTVSCPSFSRDRHGFSYSLKTEAKGRSIQYQGKEIGKFHFDTDNFEVSNNIAATIKLMLVGDESYQQGLHIWNNTSATWQKVESEEIISIIGWISR